MATYVSLENVPRSVKRALWPRQHDLTTGDVVWSTEHVPWSVEHALWSKEHVLDHTRYSMVPTEGGIFEARVGFYIFLEIFGSILIKF